MRYSDRDLKDTIVNWKCLFLYRESLELTSTYQLILAHLELNTKINTIYIDRCISLLIGVDRY